MNKITAAFAAALFTAAIAGGYSDYVSADLQNNLIRLHVIADSDNAADQEIKLKVRDNVLAYLAYMDEKTDVENKEECRDEIIKNIAEIEKIANETLAEHSFDYSAHAEYGLFDFPRKEYKSIILPAGRYYGVRITLGSGSGHNWWCVLYPPICINEDGEAGLKDDSQKMLKENLDCETYDIVTGNDDKIEIKFKILELLKSLCV